MQANIVRPRNRSQKNRVITSQKSSHVVGIGARVHVTYLANAVIHLANSSFTIGSIHSEEDFRLGSRRHFEAGMDVDEVLQGVVLQGMDVDEVLQLVFVVVINKWLNGPLQFNTTLSITLNSSVNVRVCCLICVN